MANYRRRSRPEPDGQQSLFTVAEQRAFSSPGDWRSPTVDLSQDALQSWKTKIRDYQTQVKRSPVAHQGSLLEATLNAPPSSTEHAEAIDPFGLTVQNFFFFQWPADRHPSAPCIYFVMDTHWPLLLYVGETCKANQRWKGVHDCKTYVLNYQAAHFAHHLPTAINTAFWWDTPLETRPRQALESALIARWKSPFNKENWQVWGTPFIG